MHLGRNRALFAVPVWDWPTRIFHLGLIATVGGCWYSYRADMMSLHRLLGDAAAGLLTFRLYWGLAGSSTARFARLPASPRSVWRYVRGTGPAVVGHNPLGSWSVVLLLSLVAVQVATGLFSVDVNDLAPGPLAQFVSTDASDLARQLHGVTFRSLEFVVLMHVIAVLAHELKGDRLVAAMVHGVKRLDAVAEVHLLGWRRALPGAAIALGVACTLWSLGAQ